MNELITEIRGKPVATSRRVAEKFGKEHDDVLRSIRNLSDGLRNFAESDWTEHFEVTGK